VAEEPDCCQVAHKGLKGQAIFVAWKPGGVFIADAFISAEAAARREGMRRLGD